MKTPSDDLFLLIKSLSKTEKRYFRLYVMNTVSLKERPYIKLFDEIERQKVYVEDILKQKKIVPSNNMKKAKWRLSKIILKCLDFYYSESIFDSVFKNQFKNILVLYQKGLYTQCRKAVNKLKKELIFYERYTELIELCRFEKKLPTTSKFLIPGNSAIETESVKKLAAEIELQNLSDDIYNAIETNERARTNANIKTIKNILNSALLITNTPPKTFRTLFYYFNAKGLCYSALGRSDKTYQYLKNQVELFKKYPHQVKQYPEMYISSINNFLISCFHTGHINEYYRNLFALKKMEKQYIKSGNKRLATSLFNITSVHETAAMGHLGNFDGVDILIPELEEKLRYYSTGVNLNIKLTLFYNTAYILFATKNYSKALVWINKIINHAKVEVRQDLQTFARILNLIIHYEMGNSDLLAYINRAAIRFTNKKGRLLKYESNVFNFIKKLIPVSDKNESLELFKSFKKDLLVLANDPLEKMAFEEFDMIAWVDSKIEGRSFAEVVRKKYLKKI